MSGAWGTYFRNSYTARPEISLFLSCQRVCPFRKPWHRKSSQIEHTVSIVQHCFRVQGTDLTTLFYNILQHFHQNSQHLPYVYNILPQLSPILPHYLHPEFSVCGRFYKDSREPVPQIAFFLSKNLSFSTGFTRFRGIHHMLRSAFHFPLVLQGM